MLIEIYTYALAKVKISRQGERERFTKVLPLKRILTTIEKTRVNHERRRNSIPTTRQPKSLSMIDRFRLTSRPYVNINRNQLNPSLSILVEYYDLERNERLVNL